MACRADVMAADASPNADSRSADVAAMAVERILRPVKSTGAVVIAAAGGAGGHASAGRRRNGDYHQQPCSRGRGSPAFKMHGTHAISCWGAVRSRHVSRS